MTHLYLKSGVGTFSEDLAIFTLTACKINAVGQIDINITHSLFEFTHFVFSDLTDVLNEFLIIIEMG